ncbi:hypothetical protein Trydic_g22229 [Trypoxylus dichotomus]
MSNRKSRGPRQLSCTTPDIGTSGTAMLDVEQIQQLQVYPAITHDEYDQKLLEKSVYTISIYSLASKYSEYIPTLNNEFNPFMIIKQMAHKRQNQ